VLDTCAINRGHRGESSRWDLATLLASSNVPRMIVVLAAASVVAAWILLYFQVDPVPTWFYVFAWYPTLVLLDSVAVRKGEWPSALWNRRAIALFAWSPVIWFVFEAANFRLMDWYYVFLPHSLPERWTGIVLSFATVVPAILLAERALRALGVGRPGRGPRIKVGPVDLTWAMLLGFIMCAMALGKPTLFFPLIWGGVFLIADPLVYRRDPELSLLADLEHGDWTRIGRLLLSGLGIGLLWETYNFWARGKWIYTVPWLEQLKLFEMPPFGFLGFPVFALEAWSMYHLLCVLGVAAPISRPFRLARTRTVVAGSVAVLFAVTVLGGMERYLISSVSPRLIEIPGVALSEIASFRAAGVRTPFDLATADADSLAARTPLSPEEADAAVAIARLITLRGIGAVHGAELYHLGIASVCGLANRNPEQLYHTIRTARDNIRPTPAEVRVWVRAAARDCQR
jgi:hypothetical protein